MAEPSAVLVAVGLGGGIAILAHVGPDAARVADDGGLAACFKHLSPGIHFAKDFSAGEIEAAEGEKTVEIEFDLFNCATTREANLYLEVLLKEQE